MSKREVSRGCKDPKPGGIERHLRLENLQQLPAILCLPRKKSSVSSTTSRTHTQFRPSSITGHFELWLNLSRSLPVSLKHDLARRLTTVPNHRPVPKDLFHRIQHGRIPTKQNCRRILRHLTVGQIFQLAIFNQRRNSSIESSFNGLSR